MNQSEKLMFRNIKNYYGKTMPLILLLIIIGPFIIEDLVYFNPNDLSELFGFPSIFVLVFSECFFIPILLLRLYRDYLFFINLYPKEGKTNTEYDKCLVKIDTISKMSGNGRMGAPKFEKRTKDFDVAIEYFRNRVKNLMT